MAFATTNTATTTNNNRSQWSSWLAFVLATTGAAVGLGNIWKFPYMAGDNGGSAFVLVYLICVLIIGIPAMMAEMLIGRRGHCNPVNAMRKLALEANTHPSWQIVGWWGAATLILVLSFYSVVAGWSLDYIFQAGSGALNGLTAQQILGKWHHFLSNPWKLLLWNSVFMLLTLWVVARGVNRGLELASRIMMPLLFLILIVLVGYAATSGGFSKAAHFLFDPNFDKITPAVVINAMGHAFFTLAIGAGCMLIYGSYMSKQTRLASAVLVIAGLDVLVALLAGMAIFPIVFAYHLAPSGGPGLMFETLPIAFAKMHGGQIIGGLFFVLLLFAAWTSSISMAEPLVSLITERYGKSRAFASIIVGAFAWVLGIGSILSFNIWHSFRLFGHWTIFAAITDLVTNIMLPIGGMLFCIFAGWFMQRRITQSELNIKQLWLYKIWLFLVRFIAPAGIFIIMIRAL